VRRARAQDTAHGGRPVSQARRIGPRLLLRGRAGWQLLRRAGGATPAPAGTIPPLSVGLALAGGAPSAFAPPLLLAVSALALLPSPHRSTCLRCAGLRGGRTLPALRVSRMELPDAVGSKRMRTDDAAMGAKEEGDATVEGLSLSLEPQEEALFELLMQVVEQKQLPCVLRVAGGWVRDKIMGKEAHDIDIAIDTMMGQEFTQQLVDYMKENGREKEVGGVGVIKSNPDQSKHLETATLRVMGFELDFVNLRAEEYTDSRIPVMRIGTALEDAMRRDLTINALFYNINRRTVEDFTGKGMNDIQAGRVRTPLAPNQTMIDDPLRALRTVRFACRLGFEVEEELAATLVTSEVRDALASKVSKERVNTELNGMLLGPQPAAALEMLHRFRLLTSVFATPATGVVPVEGAPAAASLDPDWGDQGLALVRRVAALSPEVLGGMFGLAAPAPLSLAVSKEWGRLLYLAAMLAPLKPFQLAGDFPRSVLACVRAGRQACTGFEGLSVTTAPDTALRACLLAHHVSRRQRRS